MNSNQSNQLFFNEIRTIVQEELSEIGTSVSNIDENVNKQLQFTRHTINENEAELGCEQNGIEQRMSFLMAHPDDRGVRHIPATISDARIGFLPTKTNKTPSATSRINALINYLWKRKQGSEIDISLPEQRVIRLQFHAYTRHCRLIMRENGIDETNWGRLSTSQKLYYSLRLEEMIFTKFGYELYECERQWAASLLLQEAMKAERQTEKRRNKRRLVADESKEGSSNEDGSSNDEESSPIQTRRTRRGL